MCIKFYLKKGFNSTTLFGKNHYHVDNKNAEKYHAGILLRQAARDAGLPGQIFRHVLWVQ